MPCRIDIEAQVVSSRNQSCIRGVKLLRAEAFDDAAASFRAALVDNPDDHRAAYGAGIACEASARYDDALRFYKRACAGRDSALYSEARDRMKAYGNRVRR